MRRGLPTWVSLRIIHLPNRAVHHSGRHSCGPKCSGEVRLPYYYRARPLCERRVSGSAGAGWLCVGASAQGRCCRLTFLSAPHLKARSAVPQRAFPCTAMAPAPTRGWTLHVELLVLRLPGSPAHAGMDPAFRTPPRDGRRLPRPRGDGPELHFIVPPTYEAPPPTRGWTPMPRLLRRVGPGSPAHTGMDRLCVRTEPCGRQLDCPPVLSG